MHPDYVVVVHVHVVLVAFFADDILREADVERAGILVAFRVTRSHAGLPRPERIDTAEYGQIDIIIESEIISGVAQEKTFLVLLAPRKHDEAGLPPARRREKAEGQHQRINRHVLHDQIRRTHDHLLAGNHLGFGHGQIEVRMIGVAGGELSSGYIDRIVLHLLDPGSEQIAFSVLRRHLLDPGFLGLDVVGDRIHLVARRAVQKFGPRGLARHRVHPSVRENLLALHIDLHEVGLQVLVLILHVAFLVNIDELAARIVDQRVFVIARNHIVEKRLALHTVRRQRIGRKQRRAQTGERRRIGAEGKRTADGQAGGVGKARGIARGFFPGRDGVGTRQRADARGRIGNGHARQRVVTHSGGEHSEDHTAAKYHLSEQGKGQQEQDIFRFF